MAAEGWGEEKFIPRGWSTVKNKEMGGGWGGEDYALTPEVIVILPDSVRPRMEFLICSIKPQLSIWRHTYLQMI